MKPIANTPDTAAVPPPLEEAPPFAWLYKRDAIAACILLGSAGSALVLANSSARDWYHTLWHADFGVVAGRLSIEQSLHAWINDGLMAIFFFVIGLEIKRELIAGELATFRKAMLPVVAAFGGMICPALIFAAINWGAPSVRGWGIPMATDIAFATGCLALLGGRVHPSLGVFLVALAIVDDLGSVLVIAVFYTGRIQTDPLLLGIGLVALSYGLNVMGVRRSWPYALIGLVVWWAFLRSGVHATIAGVLLALTIPATARYETPLFSGRMTELLKRFADAEDHANPLLVNGRQQELLDAMNSECHHVEAPLQRIERVLHPLCVLAILPLFAFANSGVTFDFDVRAALTERVTLGVCLGLVLGKQIGITLGSWLAVTLRLADLPGGMTWRHVYGLSWLAGIGFTMALFIGELAFVAHGDDAAAMARHLAEGKIGVFTASIVAGVAGLLVLRGATRGRAKDGA